MKTKVLFFLMTLLPMAVSADAVEIDGIYYKIDFAVATVSCNPNKYSGDVVIPDSIKYFNNTYPVKKIENEAFADCDDLTSIEIPNNITHIGRSAFGGCINLQAVNITDLTSWCNICFFDWAANPLFYAHHLYLNGKEIKSLVIPETVNIIREFSFSCCNSINSITISESVTTIEDEAFYYCSGLTTLTIPKSVTSIGETAFRYCCGLLSVKVETGNIKYDSRNDCNAIIETATNTLAVGCQNTRIPSSVTSIGKSAFYGCLNLSSISIPNSITSIGSCAFSDCKSLHSVTIPVSVTNIGHSAFLYGGLTSVIVKREIPLELKPIDSAFPSSATLYVPDGCLSIYRTNEYWKNFNRIIELKPEVNGIYYSLDKENMKAEVSALNGYESLMNKVVVIPASNANNIVIPSSLTYEGETYSVTSIGERAFSGCDSLMSIVIPNSVVSIGESAFSGCKNLSSIIVENGNKNYDSRDNCNALIESSTNTLIVGCKNSFIPQTVTSIGDFAFSSSDITSITIPKSVATIGEGAFSGCVNLTSVAISKGMTSIGNRAFYECNSLTSITIPNSVASIGEKAFSGCAFVSNSFTNNSKLTNDTNWGATICDEETNDGLLIKDNSVVRCRPWATSATIPNRVISIGNRAFSKCWSLTSITIPNGVASIGNSAFYDCSGLTSITIPNSVTIIGKSAFRGCSGLTSVTIPNSVTSIGEYTFSNCSGLTSVTMPNNVTNIGRSAFSSCSSLTSVAIPNSVTSIGYSAFLYCSGLTSVTIPNSVTSIDRYSFAYCSSLTSITIGSGVTSIGYLAFSGCNSLTDVYCYAEQVPNTNGNVFPILSSAVLHVPASSVEAYRATAPWSSFGSIVPLEEKTGDDTYINGIFYDFSDNEAEVIKGENAYSGDVVIPASVTYKGKSYNVTSIGDNAFGGCSGLTSVTIPNSVTSIGNSAFSDCRSLASIVIPNSVTSIGYAAFQYCSGLTSVTIPNSVTSIGDEAFRGCRGLNSITIPNSVISIGSSTFEGCDGLTSITIGNGVTSIGDYAFRRCDGLTSVTLNSNTLVSANRSSFTSMKSVFGTQVKEYVIGNNVTGIGSNAFYGCDGLTSVTIPNSVTSIGDEAFRRCTGLTSVTIPNSVTSIGNYAFYECSGLTSVTIPNSVTSIGDEAFRDCDGLTSITIPGSVTSIGVDTFYGCSGLSSVIIPNSVSSIGNEAFRRCTGLTSVTIPNSVTSIGNYAFYECSGLTSVTIGNSVTSIGSSAFANCQELTDVYCSAEQVPNTADNAFENTPIESAVLQVPTSSAKEQYKTTAPWSEFGSIIAQTDEEIAGDGPQLENSSFDDWHVVGSGTQALYNPWKEGSVSFWDTGNRGATTVGASNSTYGTEDGRTYANLQSKFIVIKFAAGNIFTGSYLKTDGTNGILSLGRPFNSYPAKLQFDYTYKSSIVNKGGGKWDEKYSRYISQQTYDEMRGKPDSCCIWIALIGDKDEEEYEGVTYPFIIRTRPSTLKLFDPNSDNVIAYGQFTSGDDQTEWKTKTIDIRYRNTRTPKYIIVVATSSKYGDFFIGSDQSLLKLDNLKLLYDESIPIERETFFVEQPNGVKMEFGIISKENRTCQVGSGTRPSISTDTSGGIDIPSEVAGYSVVAVGEKAFNNCSGLTSITIPNSVTTIGGNAFQGCWLRNVLLWPTTPPDIDEEAFSKNIYNHTILYIPNGSWGEYVFNSNWYQFINIRETATEEEQLSMQQAYTLMDANTFAYSVYDPLNDCIGAVGVVNEDNPNHCWQVIESDGNHYLYNLGAKKFVTSYGNSLNLTNDVTAIEMGNGKNGITLGKQEGNQWAFVSNEHMNVEQSIVDSIIAMQGTSLSRKTGADIYDLQGLRLSAPQKGLNIIRMTDGTTRKVVIK